MLGLESAMPPGAYGESDQKLALNPSLGSNGNPGTVANPVQGVITDWGGERYNIKAPQNPSGPAIDDGATDAKASVESARTTAHGKAIVWFPEPTTAYLIKSRILAQQTDRFMGDYRLDIGSVSGPPGVGIYGRIQAAGTLAVAAQAGDTQLVFTSDPSLNGMVAGDCIVIDGPTPPAGTNPVPDFLQVAASYVSGTTVPLYEAVSQHGLSTSVQFANPVFELTGPSISFEGLAISRGMVGLYAPNPITYLTKKSCSISGYFAGIGSRQAGEEWFQQDVIVTANQYFGWWFGKHARDGAPATGFFDKSLFINTKYQGQGRNGLNWSILTDVGSGSINNVQWLFLWLVSIQQDGFALRSAGMNSCSIINLNTENNCRAFAAPTATTFTGTSGTNTGTVASAAGLLTSGHKSFATIKGAGGNGNDFYGNILSVVSTTLTFQEPAPVVAPTFRDGGAAATGLKAGSYTFGITYTNAAGETTAGPTASASLAADGNKFTVPVLYQIPWLTGITNVKFYMLTAPGGVTPGLVATRSPIHPAVSTSTNPYGDSGYMLAQFDILAGGASETPPGANTASQNLGTSVTAVDFYTGEYSNVLIETGNGPTWITATASQSANTALRYGIDHRGGAGIMVGGATSRPVYDPGVQVATYGFAGPIRRGPVTQENFNTNYFGGTFAETPRTQIVSPPGGDIVIALLDSNSNGTGTYGDVSFHRRDAGRTKLGRVDGTLWNLNVRGGVATNNGTNRLIHGSGAPTTPGPNNPNPVVGDIYFRTDTPSTANQRIYICTVGGGSPTWVGIV